MSGMPSYLYVPILKWRQGEYQALLRMQNELKQRMLPLLELCPPEYDFEAKKLKKTIDEQLSTFAKRLKAKWGERPAYVDGFHLDANDRMSDGRHPLTYIFDEVRHLGGHVIPVTGLDRDEAYQDAVRAAAMVDGSGICLRVSLDELADDSFGDRVNGLLLSLNALLVNVDIVVDLRAANFEPVSALASLLATLIQSSAPLITARTVVLAGTAFPASMGTIKTRSKELTRSEWLVYKALLNALPAGARRPLFGDYAIAGPERVSLDMRTVKPAASVRYASNDIWFVVKGSNVRDNGFGQFRELCKDVEKSNFYLDKNFSKGSEYVHDCAAGTVSTGNLTTWRWVGTNHHMTKVLEDLSSFAAL